LFGCTAPAIPPKTVVGKEAEVHNHMELAPIAKCAYSWNTLLKYGSRSPQQSYENKPMKTVAG